MSSAREPVSEGYPLVGDQPGRPPGEKARLLIVEDHPDLQNYLRTILSDRYEVITAANGAIGWEILRSAPETAPAVDLILSDLMMPVMNGYELLEKAKGDPKVGRIPFVMLTARTGNEEKIRALRVGVDDYLTKPFVEEELLARVENLLRNGAIRRKNQDEWERSEDRPALSIPDLEWLTAFEDFVRREMANNHLNVSFLAHEFAMSESTLLRQLKRLTGLTPKQYLTEVRLSEARKLLEERRFNSVKRIGKEVGFYDGSRFARQFKKRFGKLPSHYL